jgi:hypothetical protein
VGFLMDILEKLNHSHKNPSPVHFSIHPLVPPGEGVGNSFYCCVPGTWDGAWPITSHRIFLKGSDHSPSSSIPYSMVSTWRPSRLLPHGAGNPELSDG